MFTRTPEETKTQREQVRSVSPIYTGIGTARSPPHTRRNTLEELFPIYQTVRDFDRQGQSMFDVIGQIRYAVRY